MLLTHFSVQQQAILYATFLYAFCIASDHEQAMATGLPAKQNTCMDHVCDFEHLEGMGWVTRLQVFSWASGMFCGDLLHSKPFTPFALSPPCGVSAVPLCKSPGWAASVGESWRWGLFCVVSPSNAWPYMRFFHVALARKDLIFSSLIPSKTASTNPA